MQLAHWLIVHAQFVKLHMFSHVTAIEVFSSFLVHVLVAGMLLFSVVDFVDSVQVLVTLGMCMVNYIPVT